MNDYWQNLWDVHAEKFHSDQPFEQVMRTQLKVAQDPESFALMIKHIRKYLDLSPENRMADVCCGNGLITRELFNSVKEITAIDFCQGLIESLDKLGLPNVKTITQNALEIDLANGSQDRILMAAALQHFNQEEAVTLFGSFYNILKDDGLLLVTDILDSGKQWNFYNSPERERICFEQLQNKKPILGTWFDSLWLNKLAEYAGFRKVEVIEQPKELIFSHYRFDLRCKK